MIFLKCIYYDMCNTMTLQFAALELSKAYDTVQRKLINTTYGQFPWSNMQVELWSLQWMVKTLFVKLSF